MNDEEFILCHLRPTSWLSDLVKWLARDREASSPALFALTDDDLP